MFTFAKHQLKLKDTVRKAQDDVKKTELFKTQDRGKIISRHQQIKSSQNPGSKQQTEKEQK